MTDLPLTSAATTALVAPLRAAVAAGTLTRADADALKPLITALDEAVRAERVDHGDVQRCLYEATDVDHEWWTPRALDHALSAAEYAVRAAGDGTIERTWHPATPGHLDDVGQQGFDWGFHDWAGKAWHGGFADEAAARAAHDAHFAVR